ncbi:FAD-dependent oxidoreductase [Deinococcus malanensis]|uniref:FAD-dependent oxidoreductase n=1 Tax=Deinococcus malanensis TaxID=1706855 RepID=UPI0036441DCA
MTAHVGIIGGGIAGASVAYALARADLRVTVVDAGMHTASHVPSALINPVRGQSGGVDTRAPEGMALTWALVRDVVAQGYDVPHAQSGVVRPLPDDRTRARFERHLPGQLPHEWLAHGQRPEALTDGWAHALQLPGAAGWTGRPCARHFWPPPVLRWSVTARRRGRRGPSRCRTAAR